MILPYGHMEDKQWIDIFDQTKNTTLDIHYSVGILKLRSIKMLKIIFPNQYTLDQPC